MKTFAYCLLATLLVAGPAMAAPTTGPSLTLRALVAQNRPPDGSAGLRPTAPRPVLMISIDGMRPGEVLHARERGLDLPNLTAFLKDGTYAEAVHNVLPTIT